MVKMFPRRQICNFSPLIKACKLILNCLNSAISALYLHHRGVCHQLSKLTTMVRPQTSSTSFHLWNSTKLKSMLNLKKSQSSKLSLRATKIFETKQPQSSQLPAHYPTHLLPTTIFKFVHKSEFLLSVTFKWLWIYHSPDLKPTSFNHSNCLLRWPSIKQINRGQYLALT